MIKMITMEGNRLGPLGISFLFLYCQNPRTSVCRPCHPDMCCWFSSLRIVRKPSLIAKRYLKTWFLIDIAASTKRWIRSSWQCACPSLEKHEKRIRVTGIPVDVLYTGTSFGLLSVMKSTRLLRLRRFWNMFAGKVKPGL